MCVNFKRNKGSILNKQLGKEIIEICKAYEALPWYRKLFIRVFLSDFATKLNLDRPFTEKDYIQLYRSYKAAYFIGVLEFIFKPLRQFSFSLLFQVGNKFSSLGDMLFEKALKCPDPGLLLKYPDPNHFEPMNSPDKLALAQMINKKVQFIDPFQFIKKLKNKTSYAIISGFIDRNENLNCHILDLMADYEPYLDLIILLLEKNKNMDLSVVTRLRNLMTRLNVEDKEKIQQIVTILYEKTSEKKEVFSLFELMVTQYADLVPFLEKQRHINANFIHLLAQDGTFIKVVTSLFKKDGNCWSIRQIKRLSSLPATTTNSIAMASEVLQNSLLVEDIAPLLDSQCQYPMADRFLILEKLGKIQDDNIRKSLIEACSRLSTDDFTAFSKIFSSYFVDAAGALAILNNPQLFKMACLINFSQFNDPIQLMQQVVDLDRFNDKLEQLAQMHMLTSDYISALAKDIDFIDKMQASRTTMLPETYTTQIINEQGTRINPTFTRLGRELNVSGRGNAIFQLVQGSVYIEKMHNHSCVDGAIPKCKKVGAALHEYIFRESCVLPGIQGRVTLEAAWGSELFHYSNGFRVEPAQDARRTMLEGYDDKNSDILLQKIKSFWKIISTGGDTMAPDAIQALNDIFSLLLDAVKLAKAPTWFRNSLRVILETRDIKYILNALGVSENIEISKLLADSPRKAQYDRGSYHMFLPYSSIIANGKKYGIDAVTSFQPDDTSKLYAAMYETDYQCYLTSEIEDKLKAIIAELIHSKPTTRRFFDPKKASAENDSKFVQINPVKEGKEIGLETDKSMASCTP